MNRFNFALRILKRDWRGGEIQLMLAGLILAMACFTSIQYFSLSIKRSMGVEASNWLGGNLVLVAPDSIPQTWLEKAKQLDLNQAQSLSFLSVLSTTDTFQLSAIKAVSDNYPLLGKLKTDKRGQVDKPPEQGVIWLEPRLFSILEMKKGAWVELGDASFKATHALTSDPSHTNGLFNFSPKAMINIQDVAKANVIQPGSRMEYRWYFNGDDTQLNAYISWLKPKLSPSHKLLTPKDSQPLLKNVYKNIDVFLKLAALISMLLSGLVIALSVRRYFQKHQRHIALMRCFGSTHAQILTLYCSALFLIGFIGISIGNLLGMLFVPMLNLLIRELLPISYQHFNLLPLATSYAYGYLLLFGFAFPALSQLKKIQPMVLLREQLPSLTAPRISQFSISALIVFILAWWQVQDFTLTLFILAGMGAGTAVLVAICYFIIRSLQFLRTKVGVSWRYGLANLSRQPQHAIIQILSFSLTFSVLLLVTLVWQSVNKSWQEQLPPDAPNYFVFNISPDQLAEFKTFLEQNKIRTPVIYPMVRGRMTKLNGQAILNAVPDSAKDHNALHRELNLSWSKTLPQNNKIVTGNWAHSANQTGISVEKNLAEDLDLHIGDTLSFQIGAQSVQATVSSIRSVDWAQFTPNFYVLFSNNNPLRELPKTYITSFFMAKTHSDVVKTLVKQFPNVSIVDIDAILQQIRSTLMSFIYLIGYLDGFVLLVGIAILFASTQATLDSRIEESLLLRILGASKAQVMQSLLTEFIVIGIISTFIAMSLSHAVAFFVNDIFLNTPLHLNYRLISSSMILGPAIVTIAGWVSTRPVRNQSLRNSMNISL